MRYERASFATWLGSLRSSIHDHDDTERMPHDATTTDDAREEPARRRKRWPGLRHR